MDARFYNSEEINIEQLANDLENIYRAQGYQVQQIATKDQIMVQLKKGGDFETLIGMGVALSVIIQRTAGGVLGMIGQQKWMDKAAAGAVGAVGLVIPVLLPLAVTADEPRQPGAECRRWPGAPAAARYTGRAAAGAPGHLRHSAPGWRGSSAVMRPRLPSPPVAAAQESPGRPLRLRLRPPYPSISAGRSSPAHRRPCAV